MHLRHPQGVYGWLKTQKIDPNLVEDMMHSLLNQAENAGSFPNVFVFVDATGKALSLEEGVPKCRACGKWCGRTCY